MASSSREIPLQPAAEPWTTAVIIMAIGLAIRLAISYVSWGTNDAITFFDFSQLVRDVGLLTAYQRESQLNHPPIPVLWAWITGWRCSYTFTWFPFMFKLPIIAFEAVTAWVLWHVWYDRADQSGEPTDAPLPAKARQATIAVAGYAFSLCAILVSGYHCNTDTMFAGLALMSVWLLERHRPLAGGLALAAAINIKIVPVLLIPCLLLSLRTKRDALRFLAGLSVGVLPFVPVLVKSGPSFYRNAIAYQSNLEKWGIPFFLFPSGDHPQPSELHAAMVYHDLARWPLLGLIAVWAVVARWMGRWNRYEVAAVTLGLFLIFAPGFGAQYTVFIVPLLLAIRPKLGNLYSIAAGLFIGLIYYVNLNDNFPFVSFFTGPFPQPTPILGVVAWAILIFFVVTTIVSKKVNPISEMNAGLKPAKVSW